MAKFKVSKVEAIEYDFSGIPKAGGQPGELCEGSGTVAEPAPEQVDAFIQRVMRVSEDAEGDNGLSIMAQREGFIEALGDLGIPKDHLEQLPFRVLTEFLVYVQSQLFPESGMNA